MAVARLVVLAGPDKGKVFDIPLRGGGIGREVGNLIQLSDPAVSRTHCSLQLRDGALILVHGRGRNATSVNGSTLAPGRAHRLLTDDEIEVGQTVMLFQSLLDDAPADSGSTSSTQVRVTMEVSSRQLLRFRSNSLSAGDGRARGYLWALRGLADILRSAGERQQVCRRACAEVLGALSGTRADLMLADSHGRLRPEGVAVSPGTSASSAPLLPDHVADMVVRDGKAIQAEVGGVHLAGVPLHDVGDHSGAEHGDRQLIGLLAIARPAGTPFDELDLAALAVFAHLIAGTLFSLQTRQTLVRENQVLTEQVGGRQFVGESAPAQALRAFVGKVGPSDATVLLTGESGSGKEMVARSVHRGQLCGADRNAHRERALRPRERRVHRGHGAQTRPLRAGRRRHVVSR